MARPHKLTCTNHCTGCGSHFHSVKAFDRHRKGGFGSPDERGNWGPSERWCDEPADVPGLIVIGHGDCRLSRDGLKTGVPIYAVEAQARAGRRIGRRKAAAGRASSEAGVQT